MLPCEAVVQARVVLDGKELQCVLVSAVAVRQFTFFKKSIIFSISIQALTVNVSKVRHGQNTIVTCADLFGLCVEVHLGGICILVPLVSSAGV